MLIISMKFVWFIVLSNFFWIQMFIDRWAGQALFGTLNPDIIVLTLLYSIAGVFFHRCALTYVLHNKNRQTIIYFLHFMPAGHRHCK